MPEVYNPQRALTEDWRTYFFDRKDEMFVFPCVEGEVELNGRWALLNMTLIMPLIKRGRPISRDKHLFLSGIYNAKQHAKVMTEISRTLEDYGYTREELSDDLIMTANNMSNLCYTHLGGYIRTMDIFQIADTVLQPGVEEVCTPQYGNIDDRNIERMSAVFRNQCTVVDELFMSDKLSVNIFRAPLLCDAIKIGQFNQFVFSAGPKTDVDGGLFLRPVIGSFLSGMTGAGDLAIESRSAAKATYYNQTQMSVTSYGNRKIHIQTAVLRHLYPGDCGSTVYMDYTPTQRTVKHYLGKFYLHDGKLVELTRERFPEVVGKMLKVRDLHGCRWQDGYCETCGGTLTKSYKGEGTAGYVSNVKVGAIVGQQVLSTKHYTTAEAASYEVPKLLQDYFFSNTNNVYLKTPAINRQNTMALGFQPKDISRINDLRYQGLEDTIHAAHFTDIKYMYVGELKSDGVITKRARRVVMGSNNKTYPYLSAEVLQTIREHPEDLVQHNGITWLLLRHVNPDDPIMQCAVVNNDVRRFVTRFSNLMTSEIQKYRSANDVMAHACKLIWSRVDSHITHISALVRAAMITSRSDFSIPVIDDPDDVMFGPLTRIIPMRSIGGLFAFQGIGQATSSPVAYITPKRHGVFDEFLGSTDLIKRDENYPMPKGSPMQVEPL